MTKEYLNYYPYINYNATNFSNKHENIFRLLEKIEKSCKSENKKIESLEYEICNFLEKDKVYNFYYKNTEEESFSKLFQNGKIKEYDFLDFDTILKAMDIPGIPIR